MRNNVDDKGMTPLMLAAKSGNKDIVNLLLENGANAECEDIEGRTAIFHVVQSGNEDVVKLFISICDINKIDKKGNTPLSLCTESSSSNASAIFDLLVEAGAKPDFIYKNISILIKSDDSTPKVISEVMQLYQNKEIDFTWRALPNLHDKWCSIPKDEIRQIAFLIHELQSSRVKENTTNFSSYESRRHEKTFLKHLILDARYIDTPYYKEWQLVEMLLQPIYHHRRKVILSFLIAKDAKENSIELGEKIVFLNGTSPPIHEINAKVKIDLSEPDKVMAYLRFFSAYVWGEEGGFWIIDRSESLPWKENAEEKIKMRADGVIQSPQFLIKNENQIFTTVLYSDAIFKAVFSVESSGMVKMLEDDPLIADLPLIKDERIGIYRVIES